MFSDDIKQVKVGTWLLGTPIIANILNSISEDKLPHTFLIMSCGRSTINACVTAQNLIN